LMESLNGLPDSPDSVKINEIPIAWCRVNRKGEIVLLNDFFSAMFCHSSSEIIGHSLRELLSSSPEEQAKFFESISQGESVSLRSWMKRISGEKFPAIVHAYPSQFGKGKTNLVIIDDSFNHQSREKAKIETESSKHKEQLKNEFIAIASHELRTPIQPILGFALLAKRGKIGQEQAWDGVLKEARRLQQLANDILDVSRIESNTIAYKMENLRINELLKSIIDSAKADLKKEITIDLVFDSPDREIQADRSRITQVVTNLVGNAVKFTPAGTVKVESRMEDAGDFLEIKVSDSGPGIPPDILPRLFTKFATKDHGNAMANEGTGLGLYICKAIVAAHRGTINAFNGTGSGAVFVIRLPVKQTAP